MSKMSKCDLLVVCRDVQCQHFFSGDWAAVCVFLPYLTVL